MNALISLKPFEPETKSSSFAESSSIFALGPPRGIQVARQVLFSLGFPLAKTEHSLTIVKSFGGPHACCGVARNCCCDVSASRGTVFEALAVGAVEKRWGPDRHGGLTQNPNAHRLAELEYMRLYSSDCEGGREISSILPLRVLASTRADVGRLVCPRRVRHRIAD
jgi:hypothetical protein